MNILDKNVIYSRRYPVLASYLPEIIAVKHRLKKATLISCKGSLVGNKHKNQRMKQVKLFCDLNNLVCRFCYHNNEQKIIISYKNISLPSYNMNDGINFFSYPECCVKHYPGGNYPHINYLSDVVGSSCCQVEVDFKMNPFFMTTPFHLYLHLPCSLGCEDTLRYTNRLLKIIEDKYKKLYRDIVRFTRRPSLYLDVCGAGIIFKGISKKGTSIDYSDFCYPPPGPSELIKKSINNYDRDVDLFYKIVQTLKEGDNLSLEEDRLIIRRDKRTVGFYLKPAHLIWRIINFV